VVELAYGESLKEFVRSSRVGSKKCISRKGAQTVMDGTWCWRTMVVVGGEAYLHLEGLREKWVEQLG